MSDKEISKKSSLWRYKWEGFLICIFIILSSVSFIYFFPAINIPSSKEKFEYGIYLANLIAPLLSLIGAVLVFNAFKEQIKSNSLTQNQFKQSQLTSLIESTRNAISTLAIYDENDKKIEGYYIFQVILEEIIAEQNNEIERRNTALRILGSIPEKVELRFYKEFLNIFVNNFQNAAELTSAAQELKDNLIAYKDENYIFRNYQPDIGLLPESEQERCQEFYDDIIYVYFYSFNEEQRFDIYEYAFRPVSKKYEVFLDVYFNNVYSLLDFIYQWKNDDFKAEPFIKNTFTNHEKILLYHKLMSGTPTRELGKYLIELNIFNLRLSSEYFISKMNSTRFNNELEYIKPLIYKTD